MGPDSQELLERDGELRTLGDVLDGACAGVGGLVLVEGPAGIGKTSLLGAAAAGAAERGMAVLRTRGDELVMDASFAGIRELLFSTVAQARAEPFQGAARLAAPVFEAADAELLGADRVSGVMHGLFWLIADLAERRPVALIVDDAHWLDGASARFLIYLGRRVESLPVLLVVGLRRGEGADPAVLRLTLSEVASVVLAPAPLSDQGAAAVVRRVLGPRADEELCRSCREATGGNPFYLHELAAAISEESGRPSLGAANWVRSLGVGAVRRSALVRLARLGADCERFAQALAVLAPDSPLRHVGLLAGLDRQRAAEAADRLRGADLLAAGEAVTFAHPIVREAVAAELAPSRRAVLHLEAARLLIGEGAAADEVAAHLLSAERYGEGWVVEALRRAARRALAQGAPEAALAYLRRALAEPPAPASRMDVLVELGRAEALLPVKHDFMALREALTLAENPRQRAEIALELGAALALIGRFCELARLLEDTLASVGELDASLAERVDGLLLGGGGPCLSAAPRIRSRTVGYLERAERGAVTDPVMLAALAQSFGVAGLSAGQMAQLAVRALEDGRLIESPPAYIGATVALVWADEFDLAVRAQDAGLAQAQRLGSAPLFIHASWFRAETALRTGELPVAEAQLEPILPLARELGAEHFVVMFFVPVLLERARTEDAAALVLSVALTEAELDSWQGVMVLAHRGRVQVAQGAVQAGVADLLQADHRMRTAGCDLSVLTDWVPTAAGALAQLGRREQAFTLTSRELEAARAFGTPRRIGMALSTLGMLDPGEQGLDHLRQAVAALERSAARLEHARALVNLGAGLRQRGRHGEARDPLTRGLELAHDCGALALAELARAELIASGARPRREALSGPASLTPAELRTARLAAEGLTNREIAQALFVTTKTVETHLSHAYPKLGIARRADLSTALAAARRLGTPASPVASAGSDAAATAGTRRPADTSAA